MPYVPDLSGNNARSPTSGFDGTDDEHLQSRYFLMAHQWTRDFATAATIEAAKAVLNITDVDLTPYLTSADAALTYLTQADAASTYATSASVTSALAGKSNTGHTHTLADVSGISFGTTKGEALANAQEGSNGSGTEVARADHTHPFPIATVNAQTDTTYTLQASDHGKVVKLTNANPITLTVPTLFDGFNCLIVQGGAGKITVSGSGTTIRNRSSHTKSAGQYAECGIRIDGTDAYFSGDTGI